MRPNPSLLILVLASAGISLAAAPAAKAPTDTAKGRVSDSPAVLRASGNIAQPGSQAETLDTAAADEPEPLPALPAAAPAPAAPAAAPQELPVPAPRADTVHKVVEPALAEAPGLTRLGVGGTFQMKAFYHDMAADADGDKSLSFQLRRARLDLSGGLGDHFAFEGQFRLEANGRQLGSEAIYLAYRFNDLFGVKGGKLKRPFSQESMQSSKGLYTVERGTLYNAFLADTNGYASYDLGVVFHGGFVDEDVPVTYEIGVFNGKQATGTATGYANQHYEGEDAGFKAKDLAFRLVAKPFSVLTVEAALSTKAAEDRSDPFSFDYNVNTAYQVGGELHAGRLRLLGEAAWGDNHRGEDERIISGTALFFAFYGAAVWREDYSRGRASELVLKLEGLDPDFETGDGDGSVNDGRLRYTLGCNWFFTPKVSVLFNYGVLQPITEVPGEDELVHDFDAMWRMGF